MNSVYFGKPNTQPQQTPAQHKTQSFLDRLRQYPEITRFKAMAPDVYQTTCQTVFEDDDEDQNDANQPMAERIIGRLRRAATRFLTERQPNPGLPVIQPPPVVQACGREGVLEGVNRTADQLQASFIREMRAVGDLNPRLWSEFGLGQLSAAFLTHPDVEPLRYADTDHYRMALSAFKNSTRRLVQDLQEHPYLMNAAVFNRENLVAAYDRDVREAVAHEYLLDYPPGVTGLMQNASNWLQAHRNPPRVPVIPQVQEMARQLAQVSSTLKNAHGFCLLPIRASDIIAVTQQPLFEDEVYQEGYAEGLAFELLVLKSMRKELLHNPALSEFVDRQPEQAKQAFIEAVALSGSHYKQAGHTMHSIPESIKIALRALRQHALALPMPPRLKRSVSEPGKRSHL